MLRPDHTPLPGELCSLRVLLIERGEIVIHSMLELTQPLPGLSTRAKAPLQLNRPLHMRQLKHLE